MKNWETDRLAIIDVILIRMAVSEFLYFPSIPVKVTINEYLDIAKEYSTPKSKDFINGVLDSLMREIETNDQLNEQVEACFKSLNTTIWVCTALFLVRTLHIILLENM